MWLGQDFLIVSGHLGNGKWVNEIFFPSRNECFMSKKCIRGVASGEIKRGAKFYTMGGKKLVWTCYYAYSNFSDF